MITIIQQMISQLRKQHSLFQLNLLVLILTASLQIATAEPHLIRLNDAASVAAHRPILIAHRGGIVTPSAPECSLAAIQLAADSHYDMVELDIRQSSDDVPMVFHDANLEKACGKPGSIKDYRAKELESIYYKGGSHPIIRLDQALQACRELGLGVMLDIKGDHDSAPYLEKINGLILTHQLEQSTLSITGSETARRMLSHVRFTVTNDEMERLRNAASLDLRHRFWFGLPHQLKEGDVKRLKSAGALVLPAINTFRYPAENHFELARKDIKRLMQEGVDGFQMDSIYDAIFQH